MRVRPGAPMAAVYGSRRPWHDIRALIALGRLGLAVIAGVDARQRTRDRAASGQLPQVLATRAGAVIRARRSLEHALFAPRGLG
jgi:hypothetical protein